jgi:hypothetical protein
VSVVPDIDSRELAPARAVELLDQYAREMTEIGERRVQLRTAHPSMVESHVVRLTHLEEVTESRRAKLVSFLYAKRGSSRDIRPA